MRTTLTTIALLSSALSLTACIGVDHEKYAKLSPGEIQIAGHPYKTARDCDRREPIGRFDAKCDIPLVGYRGFVDPSISVQAGGASSHGF